MFTRKEFILSTAGLAGAALAIDACSSKASDEGYEAAVARTWRPVEDRFESSSVRRELVRHATLAPSSHNTQCWRFRIEERVIAILPDLTRRCPAVDPDDHHLFVSLGCAAENLIQSARANGFSGEPRFDAAASGITVALEPARPVVSPLFRAIPERQSTRSPFDGQPLTRDELQMLEEAGAGNGVRVVLLTGKPEMEKILEFVVEGNAAQMRDPAFVDELKAWIRFNRAEAVRTGDGLFSGATGSPTMPRWLGSRIFGMVFKEKTENDKYAKHLRSSSGVAVFVSEADDSAHWVEAGRCFERFALQSAVLGIRNAMINQPVEVAALRRRFAAHLGIGTGRTDLVVRFGRGPKMLRSLRRPVEAVLV